MKGRDVPIANSLKAKSSISEVAERFEVSRPTLYKYMDFYDSGETERLPKRILEYFDMVSSENTTKDESALYLMMNANPETDAYGSYIAEVRKAVEARKPKPLEWTDGDIGTMCVPSDGKATVFFRGGLTACDTAVLTVYIETQGESTPVGRYQPEPGMSFVTVSNLPPGPTYAYTIEQRQGSRTLVSEKLELRIR